MRLLCNEVVFARFPPILPGYGGNERVKLTQVRDKAIDSAGSLVECLF
jgi:hypothetical protein